MNFGFCLLLFFSFSCAAKGNGISPHVNTNAQKIFVSNIDEFNKLKPKAGDTVVLKNGEWENTQLNFKANGTEQNPVVLMAETEGMVKLTGNSNLKIDGSRLVVDGLIFEKGYSLKDDVIIFSKTSSNCRLTNSAIMNYNPPVKETDYKWVSLYGKNNTVDHCEFTGKAHQGTTLVVWLNEEPNHHVIASNYFGPRPPLGVNGGETIRIGTSDWSMYNSSTLVENNIFDKCDGEVEIISVKSCRNAIKDNLFLECDGTLTLRHGNDNTIDGNYFIGNDKPNSGGIRVIGENHHIKNNYLYALSGKGLRGAISVMNALTAPKLNEYWQVKNTVIENNVIVQCEQALVVGSGKNDTRVLPPDSLVVKKNYVFLPVKLLVRDDEPTRFILEDNYVRGAAVEEGFIPMPNNMLRKDANGIWQLESQFREPFWLHVVNGPAWKNDKMGFKIN